jgi:hypothetical protein
MYLRVITPIELPLIDTLKCKWFRIIGIFVAVCLMGASSQSFVYAQVTITPGTDEEPEPETETEPEPETETEPEPETETEPEPETETEPGSQELQSQQTTPGPQRFSQVLDYAHFIPLTNSPGNQVKLIVNYTLEDSSFLNEPVNAVMEVYSSNQSLIRTSSFSEPVLANNSGTIQLATTFTDYDINDVTVVSNITEPDKLVSISNPLTLNLKLGQVVER